MFEDENYTTGFIKYNHNPKGRSTSDCVVRAIAKALDMEWKDVLLDLTNLGVGKGYTFHDRRVYGEYLTQHGFVKQKQPRKWDNTKYKLGELGELSKSSVILVTIAKHMTVVVDNIVRDTWDCRGKTISNYWIK